MHQGSSAQLVSAHTRRAKGAAGIALHRALLGTATARCLRSGQGALSGTDMQTAELCPQGAQLLPMMLWSFVGKLKMVCM